MTITDSSLYLYTEIMLVIVSLLVYIMTDFSITKLDMYDRPNSIGTRLSTAALWLCIVVCHVLLISSYVNGEDYLIKDLITGLVSSLYNML